MRWKAIVVIREEKAVFAGAFSKKARFRHTL